MGMREKIQSRLGRAFDNQLSDAVRDFTGKHTEDGDYDPVTGEYTGGTTEYSGRGVFDEYSQGRIDNINILFDDTNLIILANEVNRQPEEGDIIEGRRVMRVDIDPAGAHYECQLRKA